MRVCRLDPTDPGKMGSADASDPRDMRERQASSQLQTNPRDGVGRPDIEAGTKRPLDPQYWRQTLFRRSQAVPTRDGRREHHTIWGGLWQVVRHVVWVVVGIRLAVPPTRGQQLMQMVSPRRVSLHNLIPIREEWPP